MNRNVFLEEDYLYAANSSLIKWDLLQDKNVLITGSTGLLGKQIVGVLDAFNRNHDGNIHVFCLTRDAEKAEKMFERCSEKVSVICGDVLRPVKLEDSPDYIIHGASITDSRSFVEKPVETIVTTVDGTKNMLSIAKKCNASLVFLSSLEVYGSVGDTLGKVGENDYGYLDQMRSRSSYPEAKRLSECLCASYYHEFGVKAMVARLSQTFGPGVSYLDSRVFAQFARAAIEKEDIVLRTRGQTFRNYCYTRDAVLGILKVLTEGRAGEAYNIANEETGISIADMAQLVAEKCAGGAISVRYEIAEDPTMLGYAPTIRVVLDTKKTRELGWVPEVGLEEAFRRMINDMRASKWSQDHIVEE